MADIDVSRRWKVENLRKYCQARGLSTTNYKRKDELVGLAFAACAQNYAVVNSKAKKLDSSTANCWPSGLDDGSVIPDPEKLDESGWISEADGVKLWPPCMVMNISD